MTEDETTCSGVDSGHCVDTTVAFGAIMAEAIEVHVEVEADGWLVVTSAEATRRVWNHGPAEVAERLAESGGRAFLRGDAMLTVAYGTGQRAFFSIAPAPTGCRIARRRDGRLGI